MKLSKIKPELKRSDKTWKVATEIEQRKGRDEDATKTDLDQKLVVSSCALEEK